MVIVTSLYGGLQGQRQFMMGTGLAGWPFVSVSIDGLEDLFETTELLVRDTFGHLKFC